MSVALATQPREPKRLTNAETAKLERHIFNVALHVGNLPSSLVGISRRIAKGAPTADLLLELSNILDALDTARADVVKATAIAWSMPELDTLPEAS